MVYWQWQESRFIDFSSSYGTVIAMTNCPSLVTFHNCGVRQGFVLGIMLSLDVGALQSDISIYKSPLLIQGFLYKDKIVSRLSYLYNRNTCISKVTYLYKWQSGYPQPHCWPNSEQNWEALRSGNSLCLSHGLSSVGSSTCSAVSAEVYSGWVGIIPNDVLKLLPSNL